VVLAVVCVALAIATGWHLLDVKWSCMGDGDKLTAAIGLLLGLIGLAIALQQYRLSRHQHFAARAEANRRAVLSLQSIGRHIAVVEGWSWYRCELRLFNSGDRPAENVYWSIFLPHSDFHRVEFSVAAGGELARKFEGSTEGDRYYEWSGLCRGPAYENHGIPLAEVAFGTSPGRTLPKRMLDCEYRLESRDGRFPTVGVEKLNLSMLADIPDVPDVMRGEDYVDAPVDESAL
jgi:hypothetical protein